MGQRRGEVARQLASPQVSFKNHKRAVKAVTLARV